MTDEEIAAALLKRFTESTAYCFWHKDRFTLDGSITVRFTLDGSITVTPEEIAALVRITGVEGGSWWSD